MYYINIILAVILLTSCATSHDQGEQTSSGLSADMQSESEHLKYNRAISLLNEGKSEQAQKIFLQFNSERPELAGPYANLAMIALRNKENDKALNYINQALTKNPDFPQALNIFGYLKLSSGDIKTAEQSYLKATKLDDNFALAHYNLALLYDIYLQNIPKAIHHYERYLKLINYTDKQTVEWLNQLRSSFSSKKG